MLRALKIQALRKGRKTERAFAQQRARRAVTCPKPRGRFAFTRPELRQRDTFTVKQRVHPAFTLPELRTRTAFTLPEPRERFAFTLLELLVVMGIIAILMVLIVPAFTSMKSGGDVTSAAYTIKGVLDQARTYAMANDTYTWVGFFEENVSNPSPNSATPKIGRIVMSIVASKDGTIAYDSSNPAKIDTTKLIQVGKLIKIENAHLWTHTDTPSGAGSTFDTRPLVTATYCIGDTSPPDSLTPFQYPVGNPEPAAQYTFVKAVQFSPGGEARIDNSTSTYSLQTAAEVGLRETHGTTVDTISPNLVAIQFTGVGGNVKIYRR
jgi:prepilin-type N-terminal cleavage/methylation domain-containing protein